jgi:hypothetical protein
LLAAGAALFNLRLGLRNLGRRATVRLFPDPEQPDLVARLTTPAGSAPSPEERMLLGVVAERRSWHGPFSRTPLAEVLPPQFARQAVREGALLVELSTHATRDRLADILVTAVAEQLADTDRAAGERSWLPTGDVDDAAHAGGTHDGVQWGSLLDVARPVPGLYVTDRPGAASWEPAIRGLAYRDTLMALVSPTDQRADRVRCGCALQRVLLTATRFGVAVGFLDQPLESPVLRAELTTSMDLQGLPQMLLRLGYPDGTPPQPAPGQAAVSTLPPKGREGQQA